MVISKEYKVTNKEGASGHETYYYRTDYPCIGRTVILHNEVPKCDTKNYSTSENQPIGNRFRDMMAPPWL